MNPYTKYPFTQNPSQARNSWILFILINLLFFTVLMYYNIAPIISDYDPFILLLILLGVIFSVCLFAFSKQSYFGSKTKWFSISTLFILGYLIVCFQRYIDLLVGNIAPNDGYYLVSPDLINKCALLSLVGLLCFIIGYLFYNPSIPKLRKIASPIYVPTKWLIFLLSVAVFLFIYNYGSETLSAGYSQAILEAKKETMASYSEVFIYSLIYAILILHTKNRKEKGETLFGFIKSLGLLFHLSIFAYLGLFLLIGDRGFIVRVIAVYFFAYIIKIRPKINLIIFFILVLIASFGVTIIGIVRSMNPDIAFQERMISIIKENKIDERGSIFNSTAELASSVRCLHYAVDYVPNQHPFLYGYFQFRDILAAIPLSNSVTKHFMDNSFQYKTTASFITYIIQGDNYTKGDGSNVVAEFYISFGIFGVIFGLFLFGVFVKKIEMVLFACNPSHISFLYYSLAYAYIGAAISISRGTVLDPMRIAVLTFLVLVVYNYIIESHKKLSVNI